MITTAHAENSREAFTMRIFETCIVRLFLNTVAERATLLRGYQPWAHLLSG